MLTSLLHRHHFSALYVFLAGYCIVLLHLRFVLFCCFVVALFSIEGGIFTIHSAALCSLYYSSTRIVSVASKSQNYFIWATYFETYDISGLHFNYFTAYPICSSWHNKSNMTFCLFTCDGRSLMIPDTYINTINMRIIEFALHPQHETSYDSGIQLIKDFNYIKSKSRKRPRGLLLVSLNSNDWEEYWETKVIPRNGINSKRLKLEQVND